MQEETPGRGWASPGAAAEPEVPVAPALVPPGGAARPVGPAEGRGAEGVPQVAFRPMTLADVLDGGFTVIKARPRRILTLAAGFVVPVQVLAAWVSRDADTFLLGDVWFSDDPTVSGEAATSGVDVVALLAVIVIPSLALTALAAGIAHLVAGWSVGRDASGREMLAVVGRRWWPLLASFVVVHVAEGFGAFACYVGAAAVMALFVVVAPVIGAEGASTGRALGRSIELVRTRFWPVLGTALLMAVLSFVLGNTLSALPQGVALAVGLESAWPLAALGGIIGQMVTTPFVAAATVLLYFDLRVRTEGMDIELAARQALDRVG